MTSGSSFLASVRRRAAECPRRIAFAECGDARTIDALHVLLAERIVTPLLALGSSDDERPAPSVLRGLVRDGADVIDARDPVVHAATVDALLARRGRKGLTSDGAAVLAGKAIFVADAAVARADADGCVAGAVYSTADVLRTAFWLVGAAEGIRTVSSAFYMVVSEFRSRGDEVLTFTDCAVVPQPSPEQLADIAIAAARDRVRLVGDEPRVALLSYGTRGSGTGRSVEAARAALAIIRQAMPSLTVDGELQSDAALIETVAARKAPDSDVAGRANILVFPSLDAGNIAYKLVQRLAAASAVGPIIQGLARPCNDLSRGAVASDIINVAALTALQAAPTIGSSPRARQTPQFALDSENDP